MKSTTPDYTIDGVYPPADQLTYDKAGVNVAEGDAFVDDIKNLVASTRLNKPWINPDGSIAWGMIPYLPTRLITKATTDGVGTKPHWANLMNRHDTIGQDLVAMNVNDLVRDGYMPVEFLNYYASGKLDRDVGTQILFGIAQACIEAECAITGGETAEMPTVYKPGDYDLCGTAIGYRKHLLRPEKIKPGHRILASRSSGISCNGYSLVTRIIEGDKQLRASIHEPFMWEGLPSPKSLGEHILEPTRICVDETMTAMETGHVLACAHITGGGIVGKLGAVLPQGCGANLVLDTTAWPWPLFAFLQEEGNVPWRGKGGMHRTFNLGYSMMYVVAPEHTPDVSLHVFNITGVSLFDVGEVTPHNGSSERIVLNHAH